MNYFLNIQIVQHFIWYTSAVTDTFLFWHQLLLFLSLSLSHCLSVSLSVSLSLSLSLSLSRSLSLSLSLSLFLPICVICYLHHCLSFSLSLSPLTNQRHTQSYQLYCTFHHTWIMRRKRVNLHICISSHSQTIWGYKERPVTGITEALMKCQG